MRVEPLPVPALTAPERMLRDAERQLGSNNSPAALRPALNRILAKYPDFTDGYVRRLVSLCEEKDRAAILSDVNRALKYIGSSGDSTTVSLLSMRAKMKFADGDLAGAMEDLDKAIHADLSLGRLFVNRTSALNASEERETTCSWTEPDMDALVRQFPTDYRAYFLEGLYYTSFGADSVKAAIGNFSKAAQMNPLSALPHYFSAQALSQAKPDLHNVLVIRDDSQPNASGFLVPKVHEILADIDGKQYRMRLELPSYSRPDEIKFAVGSWFERDQRLEQLNKALALDPKLLPALRDRALMFYSVMFLPADTERFKQAVSDYNEILLLDPKDAGAYHHRGLARAGLGDTQGAIEDFGKAIEYGGRTLAFGIDSYEDRAEAYMKTQQWDLAIQDLTEAISLYVGGQVLLMNVNQFRTLYPEYKAASDDAIARKLHQTFHAYIEYADFADQFLHTHDQQFPSTTIGDLYLKRSDAYLKAGRWHNAAMDFRRVANGFPQHPDYEAVIDRWREIGPQQTERTYIDLKTFDDTRGDSIKLWIKQTRSSAGLGPYSVQRYELNCQSRQRRLVSLAQYDASGKLTLNREAEKEAAWDSVIPDTLGEQLLDGACLGK